nr:hypothetical protein [Tanacetum cinerariifolium]
GGDTRLLSRDCGGGGVSARRPVVSRLGWQRLLPWWGRRGGGCVDCDVVVVGGVGSRDGGEVGGVKRLWRQQVVSGGGGVGMFRWWCRRRRGVGGGGAWCWWKVDLIDRDTRKFFWGSPENLAEKLFRQRLAGNGGGRRLLMG